MGGYTQLSWPQLEGVLLQRLQDTAAAMTSNAEAAVYITEALRVLNAQTSAGTSGEWAEDYVFNFNPGDTWKSLNVAGSPRQRTVLDTDLKTQMQYMLMEPPTGNTWTGTNQFGIDEMNNLLWFRRDEILQATGANPGNFIINSPLLSQRVTLPDTVLDLTRVRWIPSTATPDPYALQREDVTSTNAYGALLNIQPGSPDSYMMTANTPLQFDLSCPPNQPGQLDMIVLGAGLQLVTTAPSVMNLPDDWCWVALYGTLADLLSNAPEARDDERAKYCRMRYERGLKAMMDLPWLLQASVASVPTDTPSVRQMDAYAQNWENTWPDDDPQIVVGGMDFVAIAPFVPSSGTTVSSLLTVVGNALVDQTVPVQLARDAVDQVLNYAQHIAMFKFGGSDFASTMPLLKEFEDYCALQNKRYAALGIFRPEMLQQGDKQNEIDPRYGPPQEVRKHGA